MKFTRKATLEDLADIHRMLGELHEVLDRNVRHPATVHMTIKSVDQWVKMQRKVESMMFGLETTFSTMLGRLGPPCNWKEPGAWDKYLSTMVRNQSDKGGLK